MITKEQIKSFKKCITPKAFNPLLAKLHYRKDKNVFVGTNTFILFEIPNPFDKYSFDFSIGYDDLKKIKGDIIGIDIKENTATIFLIKDEMVEITVEKNENFPDYEHVISKDRKTYETFGVSPQSKIFFEMCEILGIDTVETREKDIFYGQKDGVRIVYRIPLSYY